MIYDYVIKKYIYIYIYSIQYLEERIICTNWYLYFSFFLIQIYTYRTQYIIEL